MKVKNKWLSNKALLIIAFLILILFVVGLSIILNTTETFGVYYANQEIVVARYNEKLEWISQPPFNKHPVILYNKGDNDDFEQSSNIKRVVSLPNVGREMHSYFYHIIHNYDNLADVTIFLPGSADLEHKFDRSKLVVSEVERKNTTVFSCWKNENFVKENYNFQIDEYLSTHKDNQSVNKDAHIQVSNIRPFGNWFESIFTNNEKNSCVSFNSIIAVSRNTILQKPKSYYEKMMDQVDEHHNPETGHYIERSWYAVFYPFDDEAVFL